MKLSNKHLKLKTIRNSQKMNFLQQHLKNISRPVTVNVCWYVCSKLPCSQRLTPSAIQLWVNTDWYVGRGWHKLSQLTAGNYGDKQTMWNNLFTTETTLIQIHIIYVRDCMQLTLQTHETVIWRSLLMNCNRLKQS